MIVAAGGRAIVTVASDLTYNVLSTSDGQPIGLFNRLTPNGGSFGNQRVRLSVARGGRLIAVGGLPSVVLIDLDDQLRRLPWQPERLNQYCQLVSGHRLNSGQAIPIDVDEWDAMWRDRNPLRHADQQIDKAISDEPAVPDLTDRR